jgi:hypothetical protein
MKAAARYQLDSRLVQAESASLLIQAARLGDSAAIEHLIAAGANVNAATSGGTTPLMMAASLGQLAVIRVLQERGAAVNKPRNDGFNALTLACFFGHEDVVRELLRRGADINATVRGLTTPEMWATARGFTNIAELLKESRERIHIQEVSRMIEPFKAGKSEPQSSAPYEKTDREQTAEADAFFEEGIRRVGHTKWTTSAASEIKPQDDNVSADEFFDEGIRKVGQTKWTTTPPISTVGPRDALANEPGDEWKRKSGDTQRTTTPRGLEGQGDAAVAGGFLREGIRRVGQTSRSTTETAEPTDYYPKVAAGSFSPFSTLGDRLGLRWKHVALVAIFAVALSTFGAVTILKQGKSERQSAPEKPSDAPELASSTKSQPLDNERAQSDSSVKDSTEQVTSTSPKSSTLHDSSRDANVEDSPIQEFQTGDEKQTVGEPDIWTTPEVRKTVASNGRKTTGPLSSNHRRKTANRANKKPQKTRETSAPAAITFIPSQPPQRPVSRPNVIQSQPATLIEGSSNKKKVIQWP